jgi:hypothetical protein
MLGADEVVDAGVLDEEDEIDAGDSLSARIPFEID